MCNGHWICPKVFCGLKAFSGQNVKNGFEIHWAYHGISVRSTLAGLGEHSVHCAWIFLELHRPRRPLKFSAQNFHSAKNLSLSKRSPLVPCVTGAFQLKWWCPPRADTVIVSISMSPTLPYHAPFFSLGNPLTLDTLPLVPKWTSSPTRHTNVFCQLMVLGGGSK